MLLRLKSLGSLAIYLQIARHERHALVGLARHLPPRSRAHLHLQQLPSWYTFSAIAGVNDTNRGPSSLIMFPDSVASVAHHTGAGKLNPCIPWDHRMGCPPSPCARPSAARQPRPNLTVIQGLKSAAVAHPNSDCSTSVFRTEYLLECWQESCPCNLKSPTCGVMQRLYLVSVADAAINTASPPSC